MYDGILTIAQWSYYGHNITAITKPFHDLLTFSYPSQNPVDVLFSPIPLYHSSLSPLVIASFDTPSTPLKTISLLGLTDEDDVATELRAEQCYNISLLRVLARWGQNRGPYQVQGNKPTSCHTKF